MNLARVIRFPVAWQPVVVLLLVAGVVVAASMALVLHRNRHRTYSRGIAWALDALENLPDSTVARVYPPAQFSTALATFRVAARRDRISVDSVVAFYHAYARAARDGKLTSSDIAVLGPYLHLPPAAIPEERPSAEDAAP